MAHAQKPDFVFRAKRTSPFKSARASVQSTTGSRVVRISGSNAGYTMFWGSVKGIGYTLHSPVSPSLPLPCVAMCHHISNGVYVLKSAIAYVSIMDIARINTKDHILLTYILFQTVTHRKSNLGHLLSNEISKHDFLNNIWPTVHLILHYTFNYQLRCTTCIMFIFSHISVVVTTRFGVNHLKPTGHVMHQQFNIQQLYALPTLYLCVLCLSENKQRLVPLTA